MILLDTHALVWAVADRKRLSKAAMAAIAKAQTEDGVALAAISLWELAMLLAHGRIQAYGTVDASIRLLTEGVVIKPITAEIAAVSAQLPQDYPQDPADRLIGATARVEGMPLITRDEKLRASSLLQTIW